MRSLSPRSRTFDPETVSVLTMLTFAAERPVLIAVTGLLTVRPFTRKDLALRLPAPAAVTFDAPVTDFVSTRLPPVTPIVASCVATTGPAYVLLPDTLLIAPLPPRPAPAM